MHCRMHSILDIFCCRLRSCKQLFSPATDSAVATQVPVFLAAGMAAFNSQAAEPLTIVEQGSMLAGFLSFKLAHVQYLYSQLRPKFEQPGPKRRVPDVSSVKDVQLDVYGRSTKPIRAIEEADRVLAEEEARKRNR